MAGHSKWANIRHRKAGQDAKRGKIFTKIIRELTVAARLGGGNPADNPRLRAAVDKALGANMPRDTIDRAIDRGANPSAGDDVEELTYEGYGPGGVAIYLDCLTDNRNRTAAAVRHGFSKFGGSLGTNGSVAYLFSRTGVISFAPGGDEDAIMELALEAGADDVVVNDDAGIEVHTNLESFGAVQDRFRSAGIEFRGAEMTMLPSTEVELDLDGAVRLLKLLEHLEDLDDVQNVWSNANVPSEVAEQL
ncbi:MAG: YebC/PmpR family DNA-binding transcriptional regulator [Gammaproteobacteria bacterium]|nr:YebC/PmpR family DNA-binding transcriptional regulator [Gammaproteobacteria bacterium]